MVTVFVGADHRGFEYKNEIIEYLHEKDIRVEDLGAYELNPDDDFPDFAFKVAQAVQQNPAEFLGVLICGGGGMEITANRLKKVRCALGFNSEQVKHVKENDHVNVLAIPSDYIDIETAKQFVDIFIETPLKKEEKYLRRVKKHDEVPSEPIS